MWKGIVHPKDDFFFASSDIFYGRKEFHSMEELLRQCFLAKVSNVASWRVDVRSARDTAGHVYVLSGSCCVWAASERRAACVKLFQMPQYIRNQKMSEDASIKEESQSLVQLQGF